MHSIIAKIVFLLSLISFAEASADAKLEARQQTVTPTMDQRCIEYDWTANMSTIGANSSYRSVLMRKSNVGTIYNARMMDAAIKQLPAMTADQELNRACGNFTERALVQAANNFSEGIVGQFSTAGLAEGIYAGPSVIFIVGAISILFSVVWVFSG